MRVLLLPVGDEVYAVDLAALRSVVGDPEVFVIPTAPPRARFLELFAEEAEVRLRRLSEHFLALESSTSAEIVGAILRDAHSLKGAAAVIGLSGVSTVAHRLEDVMEPFRSGTVAPS